MEMKKASSTKDKSMHRITIEPFKEKMQKMIVYPILIA